MGSTRRMSWMRRFDGKDKWDKKWIVWDGVIELEWNVYLMKEAIKD